MNKRICIVFLAGISLATVQSAKAIGAAAIGAGVLVSTGINKAVDGLIYLFSTPKNEKDLAARHEQLKFFTKKDFIDDIEFAQLSLKKSALDFLAQHELYKYPNFIEAIKEIFPEYATYIKALMQELNDNPKARLVPGFEVDHLYHKGAKLFKKKACDFSEFYKLVKKLYAQVLAEEQQLEVLLLIEAAQTNTSQPDELSSVAEVEPSHE